MFYLMGLGFPGGSMIKNPPGNAGDQGWIPGLRRYPRVGNGNALQYSCLENSMDRGARWAPVHGRAKSRTQVNNCAHTRCVSHLHSNYTSNLNLKTYFHYYLHHLYSLKLYPENNIFIGFCSI